MRQVIALAKAHPMFRWGLRQGAAIGFFAGAAFATLIASLAAYFS